MIEQNSLTAMTVQIIAAHVGCNPTPASDLPALIRSVHETLAALGEGAPGDASQYSSTGALPAVPVEASIEPDYIVCLEDGKKLRMLKRYLKTQYQLTPEQYRAKWGLPDDYPMVAPNASAQRRAIAKENGLGGAGPR